MVLPFRSSKRWIGPLFITAMEVKASGTWQQKPCSGTPREAAAIRPPVPCVLNCAWPDTTRLMAAEAPATVWMVTSSPSSAYRPMPSGMEAKKPSAAESMTGTP